MEPSDSANSPQSAVVTPRTCPDFSSQSVAGPKPFVNTETPCGKQVSLNYRCFAPACTLPQSLKQCFIANQCDLLNTVKMLHWLAGAKQPEGSGKHAHQNIETVASAAD
jgi:hypothetical protein